MGQRPYPCALALLLLSCVGARASVIISTGPCSGCPPRPVNVSTAFDPLFGDALDTLSAPLPYFSDRSLDFLLEQSAIVSFETEYLDHRRSQTFSLESVSPTDTVNLRTVLQVEGDLSLLNDIAFATTVVLSPDFGARPTQLSDLVVVDTDRSTLDFTAVLDASEFSGKEFYSIGFSFGVRFDVPDFSLEREQLFEQVKEQVASITVQSASIHLESRDGSARFGLRIPEPATASLIGIAATTGLFVTRRFSR